MQRGALPVGEVLGAQLPAIMVLRSDDIRSVKKLGNRRPDKPGYTAFRRRLRPPLLSFSECLSGDRWR